jgi:hypothetical protein
MTLRPYAVELRTARNGERTATVWADSRADAKEKAAAIYAPWSVVGARPVRPTSAERRASHDPA